MKQQVKISKVKGNPSNPRIIKNDKFKKLVTSIISIPAFMKLRPIILDEDFMVIGGNMRLKAHHHLNRKEIWTDMFTQADCDEMNVLAEKEERETKTYLEYCNEITIKDNVSAGEWEYDMLANEWDSVLLNEFGLDVWENEDDKEPEAGLIEDDEIPEVKESKVKRGDIWQLGEHRIMCGDSTSSDDVAKLMNGEKADMVFTDPPYGIEYQSNWKNKDRRKFDTLKNDNLILDFRPVLDMFCNEICPIYIWTSHQVFHIWRELYSDIYKSTIIWYKKFGGMGDLKAEYGHNYEMCLYLTKNRIEFISERPKAVWEIASDNPSKYKHPTQKPIELALKAFSHHKAKNILDLFLGSGSTLIAAEKLNRKCYGMELDEKYCDVIIERWEQFTGQKAIKNGTE